LRDVGGHHLLIRAYKRETSREHLEKDYTQSVDIGAMVEIAAEPLLWRHVRRRSGHPSRERQISFQPREPEIDDDQSPAFVKAHVFRFQIPMNDAVYGVTAILILIRVCMIHRRTHLAENGADRGEFERSLFEQPSKITAPKVLHDEKWYGHLSLTRIDLNAQGWIR
jgi:hypothetical protein